MNSQYGTAQELVSSVETLFTLPDVYLRVKQVIDDPDSFMEDLVNAISIDPGITVRLLRMVKRPVQSIGKSRQRTQSN